MKVLSWVIKFKKEVLKWTKQRYPIEKMPCPKDIKGIRSFLGHAGFYRRFIKDFSKICRPVRNLLQKNVLFVLMMIV